MIPQNQYSPAIADQLRWYLIQELRRCMQDRQTQEANWIRWEKIYRARPSQSKKDFPFDNASNLVIPVAAADTDTLYARLMGMLFEPPSLWSASATRPELVDFAAAMNEFAEWAQTNELKLHRPVGNWLLELHQLGTGVLKQRYTREMKKVFEWREIQPGQTWQQQAVVLLKDHPEVNHVRLHDFFNPAGFPLINEAPWCAERIRLTYEQYMRRAKAGIYTWNDNVARALNNPVVNQVQAEYDRISQYTSSINRQGEFYEFWLDFDIDQDGWDEALVCTIHLETQQYVRLDYNPWFNQEKPYSSANFMRDVNSFYGIGLCEMLDHFQEEITAMHNQRIDNGTLTNSAMWAVKKDNTTVKARESIFPSKIWRLNDPQKDIVRLPMGSGGSLNESIESENQTRSEAQRRTGVNDYVQAQQSPDIGYGTAYTTQQMLLQSSKRFGETLREVRECLSEVGTRVFELYQQFNPRGKPYTALGMKDGQMVDMILRMPTDLIRRGLKISVTAIDASNSKDAQIRTTTIVFQQLSQFYQNYMMMLSYAANPQMPPQVQQVAIQAAEGSAILMRRLLELYGEQDYDRILPDLQGAENAQQVAIGNIQSLLQSSSMVSGPPITASGAGGPMGNAPQPGMGSVQGQAPGPPMPGGIQQPSPSYRSGRPLPAAGRVAGASPHWYGSRTF